jgi:hypothetical protein
MGNAPQGNGWAHRAGRARDHKAYTERIVTGITGIRHMGHKAMSCLSQVGRSADDKAASADRSANDKAAPILLACSRRHRLSLPAALLHRRLARQLLLRHLQREDAAVPTRLGWNTQQARLLHGQESPPQSSRQRLQ